MKGKCLPFFCLKNLTHFITPVGGADKISTFVALLGANNLNIAILRDFSSQEIQKINNLIKNGFLPDKNLILLNKYNNGNDADIEDLLGTKFYLELVNNSFKDKLPSTIKEKDLPQGSRIVKRLEKHFKQNTLLDGKFNHYKPSITLQRNYETYKTKFKKEDLENFSNIFQELNSLLPQ